MSNAPTAFTLPVAALLLIIAAVGVVTAGRGWTGTLTRAGKLGIHSPAASAGDEGFAVANRVAAPVIAGAAAVAALMAALVLLLPLPSGATVVIGVLGVVAVLVLLMAGGILGEKAARTVPVPARRPTAAAACDGCACGGGGCAGLTRTTAPLPASAPPVAAAQVATTAQAGAVATVGTIAQAGAVAKVGTTAKTGTTAPPVATAQVATTAQVGATAASRPAGSHQVA